jgi:PAS domain S-box-containing protein
MRAGIHEPIEAKVLRILMVEDSPEDAELIELQLSKAGYQIAAVRVASESAMLKALANSEWDVIVSDYSVPGFGALPALKVLKRTGRDIPFIIVSGIISDEMAVAIMRAGAHDYLRKDNLSRLPSVIDHEMQEAANRQQTREMESTLRLHIAALDSAANSIVITDRTGTIQWVNAAFTKLTGYPATEAIGGNLRMLKSGKQDEQVYKDMWNTILSGAVWRGEIVNRRKDDSLYVEEMTITPVLSGDSTISHFVAVKEDVTARKQAEETLRRQASLIDLTPDAVMAWRMDGILTFWNRGAEALYGWRKDEAIGQLAHGLFQTKFPQALEQLEKRLKQTGSWSGELSHRTKDGREIVVLSRWLAQFDARGEVSEVLESNTDVTERKLTELALIRSEKLASVGRMAATVAHEINNPLTSAITALYLIRTDSALPESIQKNLVLAEQELRRVAHVSQQSLGFYREVGNMAVVNLEEVLDSILDIYEPRLRNKNISLQRRYQNTVGIFAAAGEIRQVASNIIANSIDALPQNGKLFVRLTGPQVQLGNRRMIRVTIADNGEGISSKDLPHICEPFFTTKQSIGTGLGLWVTSEMVKKHEGRLRIRSKSGEGTVVAFWLPTERRKGERKSI